jgi:hypothetical protein
VRVNELLADGGRSGVLKEPRLCSDEVAARFVAGGAGDFGDGDGSDASPKAARRSVSCCCFCHLAS